MAGATGWTGTRTRTAVMAIAVAYALACCCTLIGVASAAPLNVHVVPHSHNDAGWLKTVDQYYYGSQAGIDNAGVQYILDSVIAALLANPARKFIYVEMSFMSRWWDEQNEGMKKDVRKLVANGQLEFISGGWCMHDEATTHYVDLIDQMSLGHKFLQDEFGIYPSTSWQVDPFGHSATHASLLTYEAGFDAMYFGRIDGDDIARRQASLETEMVWRPSESAGPGNQIFAGAMYWGYSAPDNFCFDSRCTDEPLMDDPRLAGYNVDRRVGEYVSALLGQAATTQGGEIMVMAGDDFNYHNANMYFKNLEKLMHYVNIDGRLNMFYSTPSIYTKARNDAQKGGASGGQARGREQEKERKNQRGSIRGRRRARDRTPHPPAASESAGEGLTWPLKAYSDFFPYAHPSQPHAFWSGFYTSRPALKRNVRKWSGALQAGRVLAYLAGRSTGPGSRQGSGSSKGQGKGQGQGSPGLSSLREAVALAQHHDAITGTSMQHVACDYTARLDAGWTAAEKELAQNLAGLLARPGGPSLPPEWRSCPLANVSLCPSMLPEATQGGDVALALFNGLGHDRTELVLVPVASNSSGGCSGWAVLGPEGGSIEAQVLAADPAAPGSHPDSMPCTLAFLAEVPALAGAVYFLRPVAAAAASAPRGEGAGGQGQPEPVPARAAAAAAVGADEPELGDQVENSEIGGDSGDDLVLSNEFLSLRISRQTGLITTLTLLNSGPGGTNVTVELTQDFWAYTPHQEGGQGTPATGTFNSGAYVFRPNATVPPRPVRSPSPSQRGRGWSKGRGRGAGAGEGRVLLSGHVGTGAVQQVVQTFAPWLHQTVRLVRGEPFLRLEWSAGPLPITGGFGMELVSRFSSNIASAGAWATDSNGRELQPRARYSRPDYKVNITEPVAGEYYPVTSVASLEGPVGARGGEGGEGPTVQMALVVDRAQGCSSLVSGALECMLHRRLLVDDGRGVREPLNETDFMSAYPDPVRSGPGLAVRGTTFLVVTTTASAKEGAKDAAAAAAEVGRTGKNGGGKRAHTDRREAHTPTGTAPPVLGVGVGEGASAIHRPLANRVHVELLQMLLPLSPAGMDAPSFAKRYSTRFGGMRAGTQLPPNVELATMEYEAPPASAATAPGNANATATPAGSVLLRLAHQFGLRESPTLSQPATVDLAAIFSTLPGSDGARREVRIGSVTEMGLTGTRALESMPPRLVWHVRGETEADRAGYEQQSKARHLPPRHGTVVALHPMQVRTFNVSLVFVDEREIEIEAGREQHAQQQRQDLSLEQRIALKRNAARNTRSAAEELVALD